MLIFFFFNDTATTEIYTLSLHDALPLAMHRKTRLRAWAAAALAGGTLAAGCVVAAAGAGAGGGIYFTQRGAETGGPAPVDRAAAAPKQAVTQPKNPRTKAEGPHTRNR